MSSIINKAVLKHLSSLARIELNAKETNKFLKDFAKITEHFSELEKINTDKIEPMIGGTNLKNILREDDVDFDKRAQSVNDSGRIMRSFPKSDRGYLKIPPVFDDPDGSP